MEMPAPLVDFETILRGRSILVTGHTGFTGTWATHWLSALGAQVYGVSLPPPTTPSLFETTSTREQLASHRIVDIGETAATQEAAALAAPDAVLHLAAQPLVRRSYAEPVETYRTNVIGTVNVLEAARASGVAGAVCITTDKVYHNEEWLYGYRETDRHRVPWPPCHALSDERALDAARPVGSPWCELGR